MTRWSELLFVEVLWYCLLLVDLIYFYVVFIHECTYLVGLACFDCILVGEVVMNWIT